MNNKYVVCCTPTIALRQENNKLLFCYRYDANRPDILVDILNTHNIQDKINFVVKYNLKHNDYIVFNDKNGFEIYTPERFHKSYKQQYGFTKAERSSFSYWFAHWCAFNMLAISMKRWKFKYLFHDFEKPWMKLFCNYKTVQTWHRNHNAHHLEYGLKYGWDKVDWEALIIDWECSRFTKTEAQLDAYETMKLEASTKWKNYAVYFEPLFIEKLNELNL